MAEPTPLIEVSGLTRDYGPLRALDGVDFRVGRGEVLGLLGPNGAGKTTALQIVCGTLAPSAGRVGIDGIDLLEAPRRAKRALGYLPERPPLYPDMTVAEYLGFAAALRGVPAAARPGARERALARCGLEDMGGRLIGNLSRGYQQRVGIAQAIVHEPAAVVLDEPTVGLDPIQVRAIRALIAELGRDHGVILSTHILPEVQTVCSCVAILHRGRVAFAESLAALAGEPADRVLVRLRRDPGEAALAAIDGVAAVEALGGGRHRLRLDPGRATPEALAQHAVERGWGLAELTPEGRSLEQIFVEATTREAPAEAA